MLNLMFIQIFTHVEFAENKNTVDSEDVYFFAEFIFRTLKSVSFSVLNESCKYVIYRHPFGLNQSRFRPDQT